MGSRMNRLRSRQTAHVGAQVEGVARLPEDQIVAQGDLPAGGLPSRSRA
jgi:hypothetical protein